MSPELVSDIARVAHEKLLSILTECGIEKTAGTCLFASYLVCYLAKTKGLDAVVRGGNGADDGGIFIECGGFGHYWCELNFEEVQYYIDITSEQFGFHPYWICPYISRHLLSLNPLLACCRRYSRGER